MEELQLKYNEQHLLFGQVAIAAGKIEGMLFPGIYAHIYMCVLKNQNPSPLALQTLNILIINWEW